MRDDMNQTVAWNDLSSIRDRVNWKIAEGDPMFSGSLEHYAKVGESALRSIMAVHALLGTSSPPQSVLDFACADGRVTRWLRAAFPDSDLHVSDIIPEWYHWSAQTFNATGWPSTPEFHDIVPPRTFDLIWCGSLTTHITLRRTLAVLEQFHSWLSPQGIAFVTMHGSKFIDYALAGSHLYFANMEQIKPLMRDMAIAGFGYQAHPGQDQGISAATPAWMISAVRQLGARLVSYCEHGWDNHQDVIAFQKVG